MLPFADVVNACASLRDEGTWIGDDIQQAYCQLHALGHAHSVEVWQKDKLVGGLPQRRLLKKLWPDTTPVGVSA